MKITVALIFGGVGYEREVSLMGARFVYPNIPRENYDVIPIFITPDGRWLMRERDLFLTANANSEKERTSVESIELAEAKGASFAEAECANPELPPLEDFLVPVAPINLGHNAGLTSVLGFIKVDVAFPLLHGDFGEDGIVQGALENAKIKYVGEDVKASVICLDKALCHLIAEHLRIPTAKWISLGKGTTLEKATELIEGGLSYPVFLKPACLGSSVGAAPVLSRRDLKVALESALALTDKGLIVEELVDIECELEIGVLVSKGKHIFTNIGKIEAHGFYDYKEKYSEGSSAAVEDTPHIEVASAREILEYARRLAEHLGLRSLSRIDFFLAKDGRILFNEINTMPGFTPSSLYPRLASGVGFGVKSLLHTLISEALL